MILKLEAAERELHESKSEASIAAYRLEELMDQMSRLEQVHALQRKELSDDKSALEANHQRLLADLKVAFEQCSALQADLIAVHQQLDSAVDENRELTRKLESLQEGINTTPLNGVPLFAPSIQQPLVPSWRTFHHEEDEPKKDGEELKYANEALRLYRTLNEELRQMQSTLKSRLWEAEDRYELAMQANRALISELSCKSSEHLSLVRERESLSFELASLRSQVPSGVVMRAQMLQASLEEMKRKYNEVTEAKDHVSRAHHMLGKEMNALRRDHESTMKELLVLQQLYRKSEEDRNRSEAILMITNEELSEAMSKIAYLSAEIKQLEIQLEHAVEDADNLRLDVNAKVAELEVSQELAGSLQSSLDDMGKEHDSLRKDAADLQNEIGRLRRELIEKGQQLVDVTDSSAEKMTRLEQILKNTEAEVEALDVDLTISLIMVIEEVTVSRAQLEAMTIQRQMLIQCIEAIELELDETSRALRDKDIQISSLNSDVEILRLKLKG